MVEVLESRVETGDTRARPTVITIRTMPVTMRGTVAETAKMRVRSIAEGLLAAGVLTFLRSRTPVFTFQLLQGPRVETTGPNRFLKRYAVAALRLRAMRFPTTGDALRTSTPVRRMMGGATCM